MQEKGYHEIAVEYLNMLKQQPALPPDMASVWDLEMSKSLRGSATRALNAKDFEESMNSAQQHLDKFLKENPNHPEAVNALVSAGDVFDGPGPAAPARRPDDRRQDGEGQGIGRGADPLGRSPAAAQAGRRHAPEAARPVAGARGAARLATGSRDAARAGAPGARSSRAC